MLLIKGPDILRLQANIVDGYFDIKAQIIECKRPSSQMDISKMLVRIERGLETTLPVSSPVTVVREGIKDRPDQRYWWIQLHSDYKQR